MIMTKTQAISVELTPEELAQCFWNELNGDEQARFFNEMGRIASDMLCFQLQHTTDSFEINRHGRFAMSKIGEYSE